MTPASPGTMKRAGRCPTTSVFAEFGILCQVSAYERRFFSEVLMEQLRNRRSSTSLAAWSRCRETKLARTVFSLRLLQ